MLASEIATRVKRQFGDESGIQITDEDILRWINDAQRDLAVANDLLQTTATTPIIKGQDQYHLPPDILSLRSVRVAGRRLEPVSIEQAASQIPNLSKGATGTPTHFTTFALKIDLYPTPDFSDGNDLQLYYTRAPLQVKAMNEMPEISIQYHNAIVAYCMKMAYELDENWQAASLKEQQMDRSIQELRGREVTQDYYPSITSVEDWL